MNVGRIRETSGDLAEGNEGVVFQAVGVRECRSIKVLEL